MLKIQTQRLTLIAATAELARPDVDDRARFSELLGARVPDSWPIEVVADAQEPLARSLESGAVEPGWSLWYIIEGGVLAGVVGHYGAPDTDEMVTIGYGIAPEVEGKGFATEALAGLMAWALATGRVRGFRATTFERHFGSIRVLEKNGFRCIGVSPGDADAAESDRQGRGRLMIWETSPAAL